MTELQSFSPRVAQVFVDGSASTTMATVNVGSMLGTAKVTRITEEGGVIIVERDGLPSVRIYAEGYGVEKVQTVKRTQEPELPVTNLVGPTVGGASSLSQQGKQQQGKRR